MRLLLALLISLGLTSPLYAAAIGIAYNTGTSGEATEDSLTYDYEATEFGFALVTGKHSSGAQYRMTLTLNEVSTDYMTDTAYEGIGMTNVVAFRLAGSEAWRLWLGPQLGWGIYEDNFTTFDGYGFSYGAVFGADFSVGPAVKLSAALEYRQGTYSFSDDFSSGSDYDVDTDEMLFRAAVLFPFGDH